MKKKMKFIGFIFLVMVLALIVSPSQEEQKAQKKAEIEKLKIDIKRVSILEVEKNLQAYKKLSEYYANNKIYQAKYEKYLKMQQMENICFSKIRDYDKNSLVNKQTYEPQEIERITKWISQKQLITNSSFIGSNKLNIKFNYRSQYKCTKTAQGLRIKKIFLKQI